MQKITSIAVLILVLLISVTGVAFGSPETIRAENGLVLPPTGLEIDFNSNIINTNASLEMVPSFTASVSYGAFPSVTITGEFTKSFNNNDLDGKLVKLYFSPSQESTGYTAYLGYDLDKAAIPLYGVSLWFNSDNLLAFVNLETRKNAQSGETPFMITPGGNLRLGKLRIGGEVSMKPEDWSFQDVRAGISYAVFQRIYAKFSVDNAFNNTQGQVYQLGLSAEI